MYYYVLGDGHGNYLALSGNKFLPMYGIDNAKTMEVADILHFLEFTNINAYEGWLVATMLKNRLLQRRKYKDEMEIIHSISESKFAQASVTRLNGMISHLHTRTYKPRVLTGLFDSNTVADKHTDDGEIFAEFDKEDGQEETA